MSDVPRTSVVVDTNIVSYMFKQDTRGELYRAHIEGHVAIIAAQTRAELERWMLQHNWGARRRDEMREYLRGFILAPVDASTCEAWAEAVDSARRNGKPILTADAWVAATSLTYDVPLVTHNPDDFAGVAGLNIITEA